MKYAQWRKKGGLLIIIVLYQARTVLGPGRRISEFGVDSVTPVGVHSLIYVENSPTLDQFAVPVLRSESLQIYHGSLHRLGLEHSALHAREPGDMNELPPFSPRYNYISSCLRFGLRDITRLSWTRTASATFAFDLEKDLLDSLFTTFYNCCRIHIIRTCCALLSTVTVEFV